MYNTHHISQVLNTNKSPVHKGFYESSFSQNKTKSVKEASGYINRLRGYGKAIYAYYDKRRNLPVVKLKNKTVSDAIGCDIRTVKRWTSKFHKDGIISKEQPHIFSPNIYKSHVPKSLAFQKWFNSLSCRDQDLYITHGILVSDQTVTPIYNLVNIKPSPIINPIPIARAREKGRQLSQQRKDSQDYKRFKTGLEVMREEAKNWIMEQPDGQDILKSSKADSYLISPTMKAIASLLKLNEVETFKLLAFGEEALQFSLEVVQEVLDGKRVPAKPINDGFAWFQAVAKRSLEESGKLPDWRLFYDVCKAKGLNPTTKSEPKPLKGKSLAKNPGGHSPANPKPFVHFEDKLYAIKKSIIDFRRFLADPVLSTHGYGGGSYLKRCLENKLDDLRQLCPEDPLLYE